MSVGSPGLASETGRALLPIGGKTFGEIVGCRRHGARQRFHDARALLAFSGIDQHLRQLRRPRGSFQHLRRCHVGSGSALARRHDLVDKTGQLGPANQGATR